MYNLSPGELASPSPSPARRVDPASGDRLQDTCLFATETLTVVDRLQGGRVAEWSGTRGGGVPAVVFVRSGVFECKAADETVFTDPLHVKFYNAAHEFRFRRLSEGGEAFTLMYLRQDLLNEVFGDAGYQVTCGGDIHYRQLRLYRAIKSGLHDRLEVEEAALELLGEVAQAFRSQAGVSRPGVAARSGLRAAQACLASDPACDHRLSDLARIAGCSEFHFARLFRSQTGRSVRAYRRELRVSLALKLLGAGQDNLSAVAMDSGFSHHSHMTAAFRDSLGHTPSEARRHIAPPPRRRRAS